MAKYHDGNGQTWSGIGKRPRWFVQALEAGAYAESMLVPGVSGGTKRSKGKRKSGGQKRPVSAGAPKYQDPSSGKTWTGRGTRPSWFVEALAAGKAAEELLIGTS